MFPVFFNKSMKLEGLDESMGLKTERSIPQRPKRKRSPAKGNGAGHKVVKELCTEEKETKELTLEVKGIASKRFRDSSSK